MIGVRLLQSCPKRDSCFTYPAVLHVRIPVNTNRQLGKYTRIPYNHTYSQRFVGVSKCLVFIIT
jgi:hypothetical protein